MAPDQPAQNTISLRLQVGHFSWAMFGHNTNSSQPVAPHTVASHNNKPSALLVHILPLSLLLLFLCVLARQTWLTSETINRATEYSDVITCHTVLTMENFPE